MITTRRRQVLILSMLSSGSLFPLDLNFALYADGPLPAALSGPTWTIVSGKATNTPDGTEQNTDVTLENSGSPYTGGKATVLATTGGTTTQSADAHSPTKAQQWAPAANNIRLYLGSKTATALKWIVTKFWGKVVSGSTGQTKLNNFCSGQLPESAQSLPFTATDYTEYSVSFLGNNANAIFGGLVTTNAVADTVVIDDFSQKVMNDADLPAWLPQWQTDVILKIIPNTNWINDNHFGFILRDADKLQTNCLFVLCFTYAAARSSYVRYAVVRRVGASQTVVVSPSITPIVASAFFEVRLSGADLSLYYNGSLLTSYTIVDSELLVGKYHGMFNLGGQQVERFFAAAS